MLALPSFAARESNSSEPEEPILICALPRFPAPPTVRRLPSSTETVPEKGLTPDRRRPPARPGLPSYWGDRYGGLWRRELLIQGNTLLTNLGTGNRILIPLRYPCKPPLKGEVGYCRY